MKFGNLVRSAFAACVLVTAAAHATPLYFFGNGPTANGSFPQGCPTSVTNCAPIAQKGLFNGDVLVTATETFEGSTAGFIGANTLPVLSGGTLGQAAPPAGYLGGAIKSGAGVSGRFNTTNGASAGNWFESDHAFTIQLTSAVGAFGFYGTDFNDFAGMLEIELLSNGNRVYENVFTNAGGGQLPLRTNSTNAQDGSLVFFGFASDLLFDRIVFKVRQDPNVGVGDQDYLGFDDIMVGNLRTTTPPNPAPEPGSLALVGLALFAAGWARKTQRPA